MPNGRLRELAWTPRRGACDDRDGGALHARTNDGLRRQVSLAELDEYWCSKSKRRPEVTR
jgi:hypothetical protein